MERAEAQLLRANALGELGRFAELARLVREIVPPDQDTAQESVDVLTRYYFDERSDTMGPARLLAVLDRLCEHLRAEDPDVVARRRLAARVARDPGTPHDDAVLRQCVGDARNDHWSQLLGLEYARARCLGAMGRGSEGAGRLKTLTDSLPAEAASLKAEAMRSYARGRGNRRDRSARDA